MDTQDVQDENGRLTRGITKSQVPNPNQAPTTKLKFPKRDNLVNLSWGLRIRCDRRTPADGAGGPEVLRVIKFVIAARQKTTIMRWH
jgi:hypothetical protein